MDLFKRIMKWLGRHRTIYDRNDKEPYLERYYLLFKNRSTASFNIFLHKFLKSDPDGLHDHPWDYRTIILYGGYWEHTPSGKTWYGIGSTKYAEAKYTHRLELDEKYPTCWTLFIPYKKTREWGFIHNSDWVKHDEYLTKKLV